MHISIVVISYNGMEFIPDCLATVVASLHEVDAEVIVVDNGSSDGTVSFIRDSYPDIAVVANDENRGFAPAVNQGLRSAGGEFILLLNQDTRIRENAIVRLARRMERDETIGTIGPRLVGFDGVLQKSCRAFPTYRHLFFDLTGLSFLFPRSRIFGGWRMGWFDHETERKVDQPMGAALMVRREMLDKVGFFDERFRIFFNDVDYCRRVRLAGYVNLYYPDAVIEHYYGGTIRTMKPDMVMESHRAMYQYFKKYGRGAWGRSLPYFWGLVLWLAAFIRAGFYRSHK